MYVFAYQYFKSRLSGFISAVVDTVGHRFAAVCAVLSFLRGA